MVLGIILACSLALWMSQGHKRVALKLIPSAPTEAANAALPNPTPTSPPVPTDSGDGQTGQTTQNDQTNNELPPEQHVETPKQRWRLYGAESPEIIASNPRNNLTCFDFYYC